MKLQYRPMIMAIAQQTKIQFMFQNKENNIFKNKISYCFPKCDQYYFK